MTDTIEHNQDSPDQPDLSQHRLDIVRDCADLAGKFPDNVTFDFVLWRHGGYGLDPMDEDFAQIAAVAEGSDIIALECAGIRQEQLEPGEQASDVVINELELATKYVRGEATEEEKKEFDRTYSNHGEAVLMISAGLVDRGTDRKHLPMFVPIDDFARVRSPSESLEDSTSWQFAKNLSDETLFQHAEGLRHRERTVIRQLYDHAVNLASDGEVHHITALMGAQHSLVSVGMRILGANVSRRFLVNTVGTPENLVLRDFRLSGSSDEVPYGVLTKGVVRQIKQVRKDIDRAVQIDRLVNYSTVDDSLDNTFGKGMSLLSALIASGKATPVQREQWQRFHDKAERYRRRGFLGKLLGSKAMKTEFESFQDMLDAHARFLSSK